MAVRRRRCQHTDPEWSPEARAASLRCQVITREQISLLRDETPAGKRRYRALYEEKGELLKIVHDDWKRRFRPDLLEETDERG